MKSAIPIILLPVLLSGCAVVNIEGSRLDRKVFELAAGSLRSVELEVVDPPRSGGTLFALLFMPMGRARVPHPGELVRRRLYQQLALKGRRPLTAPQPGAAKLRVEVRQLSVTAYDLLFTRRIVARVELVGELRSGASLAVGFGGAHRAVFKRFAFAPQLEQLLQQAVDQAAAGLLADLTRH